MQSARPDGEYNYIDDEWVVPKDNDRYEQLKHTGSEKQQPKPADIRSISCSGLPCWGWVLLVLCLCIAVALGSLVAYYLTSPATTPTSAPSVNFEPARDASTPSRIPEITQSHTSTRNPAPPRYTRYPFATSYARRTIGLPETTRYEQASRTARNPETTRYQQVGTPARNPQTTRYQQPSKSATNPETTRYQQASTSTRQPGTTRYAAPSTGPTNCQEVYNMGRTTSGLYTIYPGGTNAVQVYCEQTIAGGGWTVFQRRMDGKENFYRGWVDYRQGFGDPSGEYWLGNAYLHRLTANQDTQLMVELQYGGETRYATYAQFWVLSEVLKYRLHVARYMGGSPSPGDSLDNHNSSYFSTRDYNGNDGGSTENCAQRYEGAWWYTYGCSSCVSNLNGLYNVNSGKGVIWGSWKTRALSLSADRMMVKPR